MDYIGSNNVIHGNKSYFFPCCKSFGRLIPISVNIFLFISIHQITHGHFISFNFMASFGLFPGCIFVPDCVLWGWLPGTRDNGFARQELLMHIPRWPRQVWDLETFSVHANKRWVQVNKCERQIQRLET